VKTARTLALFLVFVACQQAKAQGLPFRVTIFDWERPALEGLMRTFRGLATGREVLTCVEAWRSVEATEAAVRVVIERVRLARGGGASRITDVGASCLDDAGQPLPMIHTHADGNCQFSPADLVTVVARRAPFEGIQCGPHHFVWAAAWQVIAIATSVEQAALRRLPQ
jgi:hypothetical protein